MPSSDTLILLAEDNEINREVVIEHLRDLGHAVDFVESGQDAVVAWEQGAYSLILMDIQMPGMDGLEATRQIRAAERQNDAHPVRIVAVTANAYDSDREDCLAAGMDDYLSKPFSDEQFCTIIDRWLPQTAPASSSPAERDSTSDLGPSAGLDSAVIEPLRVGKPDLWKRLVGIFLENTPATLAALEQAIAGDDFTSVQMTAHTLRSSCGNMGAATLSELCGKLETAGQEGNSEACTSLLADIQREFDLVAAALARDREGACMADTSAA